MFRILADPLGKDVSLEPRPIDPDLLKEAKRTLGLTAADIERASRRAKRKVVSKRSGRARVRLRARRADRPVGPV